MAGIILWRVQLKRTCPQHKFLPTKNWLKAIASLSVLMGFIWIAGVVILDDERLAPLAFIYTMVVALQGFFIFVVLVLVPKSVREDLAKFISSKSKKISECCTVRRNSARQVNFYNKLLLIA